VHEEFLPGGFANTWVATPGGVAAGRIDLLSVLLHEMGNALGLADTPAGQPTVQLMTTVIDAGERRMPGVLDVTPVLPTTPEPEAPPQGTVLVAPRRSTAPEQAATAAPAPTATPAQPRLVNGGFAVEPGADGFGWTVAGDVKVENGEAVLRERDGVMTGLSQSFLLPAAATGLRFTITDLDLFATAGTAPDAFEVALLDAATGLPVLGPIAGFGGSDAILNIQQDGTRRTASGVTVTETAGGLVVTVDFSGLAARPAAVMLAFDLLGLGLIDSEARIDAVALTGLGANEAPVARSDTLRVAEDGSIAFGPLDNDTDANDDPLTVRLVTLPGGLLEDLGGGRYRYTPVPDFNGTDSFTYVASDGALESAPATVRITVDPVNDAPTLAAVADRTVVQGAIVTLALDGRDVDGDLLTYALAEGPSGATLGETSGVLTIDTAALAGAQTVAVRVSDPAGLSVERRFTLTVQAPPAFGAIADRSIRAGRPFALALPVSDADTPAGALRFALLDGPDGMTLDAVTGALDWTPAPGTAPATVRVEVTDPDGLSDETRFVLTVVDPMAPVLAPVANQVIAPRATLVVQLAAEDPDGDAAGLVFALVDGPEGASVDPVSGVLTWPSGEEQAPQTFTVSVTDAEGLSDTVSFGVGVVSGYLPAVEVDTDDVIMRGPGQALKPLAGFDGMPVRMAMQAGVTALKVLIVYDPTLLDLTDLKPAAVAPSGMTVSLDRSVAGEVLAEILFAGSVPAFDGVLFELVGTVPETAAYGALHGIGVLVRGINGSPADSRTSLRHIVGYIGDTTGDAVLDTRDVSELSRFRLTKAARFAGWSYVDPLIVADTVADGVITIHDGNTILAEVRGIDRVEIPGVPTGFTIGFSTDAGRVVHGFVEPYTPAVRTTVAAEETEAGDEAPAIRQTTDIVPASRIAATVAQAGVSPVSEPQAEEWTDAAPGAHNATGPEAGRTSLEVERRNRLAASGLHRTTMPAIIETEGGITSLVFEVRYDPSTLTLVGALPGTDLPDTAWIEVSHGTEGVLAVMQVRVDSAAPLPAGAVEAVVLDALAVGPVREAGLHLVTLAINGAPPVAGSGAVVATVPQPMVSASPAMAAAPAVSSAVITVAASVFGALTDGPVVLGPEGTLALVLTGVAGAEALRIEIEAVAGWDEPFAVELADLPGGRGWLRHGEDGRIVLAFDFAAPLALTAVTVATLRAPRRTRHAAVAVRSLGLDGVSVPLSHATAQPTTDAPWIPAGDGGYAAGGIDGILPPMLLPVPGSAPPNP
jgi:hypothetical protein